MLAQLLETLEPAARRQQMPSLCFAPNETTSDPKSTLAGQEPEDYLVTDVIAEARPLVGGGSRLSLAPNARRSQQHSFNSISYSYKIWEKQLDLFWKGL